MAPVTIEIDGWRGRLGAEPVEALNGTFSEMVDGQTRKDMARERRAWLRLFALILAAIAFGFTMVELLAYHPFQPWG